MLTGTYPFANKLPQHSFMFSIASLDVTLSHRPLQLSKTGHHQSLPPIFIKHAVSAHRVKQPRLQHCLRCLRLTVPCVAQLASERFRSFKAETGCYLKATAADNLRWKANSQWPAGPSKRKLSKFIPMGHLNGSVSTAVIAHP